MSDVGVSYYWIRKSLLFQDPLYEVNYIYAALVAVALYEQAHSDPQFAAKYEALLSRRFYARPQALLATININLSDPALIKSAASLFQTKRMNNSAFTRRNPEIGTEAQQARKAEFERQQDKSFKGATDFRSEISFTAGDWLISSLARNAFVPAAKTWRRAVQTQEWH